jgi:hypothetical protein
MSQFRCTSVTVAGRARRVGARLCGITALAAMLALLPAGCGDSNGSSGMPPGGVEIHDNLMAFLQAPPPSWQTDPPAQPTLSLQFDYDDAYSVTAGQPWQGVSSNGGMPGSALEVTAVAGRHKSTAPATWFNQRTGLLIGYALEDGRPNELNFAFAGTLVVSALADGMTVRTTSYPIYLGQGSDFLLGDDWWFGAPSTQEDGPGWTVTSEGYLVTPDGLYVVCQKNGGYFGSHDNAFQIITYDLKENCVEA